MVGGTSPGSGPIDDFWVPRELLLKYSNNAVFFFFFFLSGT